MDKTFIKNQIEFIKFGERKNELVQAYNSACMSSEIDELDDEIYIKGMKTFPTCLKQLTRQICQCNRDCFNESYKNLGLQLACQDKETVINLFSNNYTDCSMFGIRIVDGYLLNPYDIIPYPKIKSRMEITMMKLCDENYNEFNNLECLVYEIKDACLNDIDCIKFFVNPEVPFYCRHEYSKNPLRLIEDVLGTSIFDTDEKLNDNISRNKRSSNSIKQDNITGLYTNNYSSVISDLKTESFFGIKMLLIPAFTIILGILLYKRRILKSQSKNINKELNDVYIKY